VGLGVVDFRRGRAGTEHPQNAEPKCRAWAVLPPPDPMLILSSSFSAWLPPGVSGLPTSHVILSAVRPERADDISDDNADYVAA
jgi:hypothetical protein